MENKYNLTLEQNIFLAKRNLVDNIYSNARMEGLNITFPETKTILEGINVPNLNIDEIQCILNLRDAWKYIINNIDETFNLMRSQLFWDGNKRTSTICANKIMIENGCGIIKVPDNQLKDFTSLLSEFYSTNNKEKIKQFIFDNCIDGIVFE